MCKYETQSGSSNPSMEVITQLRNNVDKKNLIYHLLGINTVDMSVISGNSFANIVGIS